jgi:hypothetical protein
VAPTGSLRSGGPAQLHPKSTEHMTMQIVLGIDFSCTGQASMSVSSRPFRKAHREMHLVLSSCYALYRLHNCRVT